MPHANLYSPTAGFSDDANRNTPGRSGVNATALDGELLRVSESINRIINNQKLLQRDDGRLGDTVVEVHTLSREVLMLLGNYRQRGVWLGQTAYTSGDVVTHDGLMYVCKTSHVSDSAFIESPNWLQFGFAGSADAAQAAAQATNAASQAISSATAAQSSATLATTKASDANASATNAATSASTAQTAATSASNSAAQATSANNAAQAAASVAQSAAQVSGISNERIIYGDDASKTSAVASADGAIASGFFESSGDVPSSGKWLIVSIKSQSGNERVQYAYKSDNPSVQYTRGIIGSNKTQWVPIWNGGNLNLNELKGVGQVGYFATTSAPAGWLKANGAAVSRETYAALFSAIGTSFGVGDGSTTFNLPDLRGGFLRGWDDGRGVDDGRVFGSIQESANKYHNHGGISQPAGGHGHTAWTDSQGAHNHSFTHTYRNDGSSGGWGNQYNGSPISLPGAQGAMYTGVRWDVVSNVGGHGHNLGIGTVGNHEHYINNDGEIESRPINIALLACIKY